MFRPPFLARVAAGAAVYALEETRRLPTAAMNFPITAISQMLQTTMHVQQFVTSLALKGDAVFDRLAHSPVEQPDWATFDEDLGDEPGPAHVRSPFDLFTADTPEPSPFDGENSAPAESNARVTETNGHAASAPTPAEPKTAEPIPTEPETTAPKAAEPETAEPIPAEPETEPAPAAEIAEPEVATRYDYATMTLAQLRARLRMLNLDDLTALLEYEQLTRARAPFVTMLTNRIATVRAQ